MRKKPYTQLTLNECYDTLDCMRESVDSPMENEIEVMMNNVILSLKEIINDLNDLNLYWNSDDIKKQIN